MGLQKAAEKLLFLYICNMVKGNVKYLTDKVMVDVLMPAYNHGSYIRQAIESFLAQENIKARLLIGDDASSDDTSSIAQEYSSNFPDRILLFSHKENMGLIKNYKFLIEHSSAPYLAILESDDYWTDPLKLFKQVSYMEEHKNCGLVFASGVYVDEAGSALGVKQEKEGEMTGCFNKVLMANPVLAVTACFRRSAFENSCCMDDFVENNFVTFDYPVWLALAACSDFYVMGDIVAAYRIGDASISNNASYRKRENFIYGIDRIIEYTVEKFGYSGNLVTLRNERTVKKMMLALAFNNLERYSYFCRQIVPAGKLKWWILRYLPFVFKFKKRKLVGSGAVSAIAIKKR